MPSELIIFIFIILGLLSGLLGGLLGIGGGVITVPILYFVFHYFAMFDVKIMQVAVSTSLASAFITSAAATYFQLRKKAVLFDVVKLLIPGLILGCIAGSIFAHFLSSHLLSQFFGIIAILLGAYFFFPSLPHLNISAAPNRSLSFFALLIGVISSMLGIGGGSLTFPVLLGYQLPAKNAAATSSSSTLLTTFFGSATYLLIAWHRAELPDTFGYIQLPAFIAISISSILTAPWGVKLSHTLDVSVIRRIFGFCLVLMGTSMLIF